MIEFDCGCAQGHHRAPLERCEISAGAIELLPDLLEGYQRVYVVSDRNTHRVAGERVGSFTPPVFCRAIPCCPTPRPSGRSCSMQTI